MAILSLSPSLRLSYGAMARKLRGRDEVLRIGLRSSSRRGRDSFIFQAHPVLQTFRSNDLYSKYPEKTGWWLSQGRAHDLVKNLNPPKFNATQIESMIEKDPCIRAAHMGGDGLKNPFMLLEVDEINMSSSESESWTRSGLLWQRSTRASLNRSSFCARESLLLRQKSCSRGWERDGQ